MLASILALGLAASSPTGLTDDEAQRMANVFASCAGVWDFMALVAEADGKASNAELAEGASRGAIAVGGWLLAIQHNEQNPADQKKVGAFMPVIEGKRSLSLLAMKAATEREDMGFVEAQIKLCGDLLPQQELMVNQIRRGFVE